MPPILLLMSCFFSYIPTQCDAISKEIVNIAVQVEIRSELGEKFPERRWTPRNEFLKINGPQFDYDYFWVSAHRMLCIRHNPSGTFDCAFAGPIPSLRLCDPGHPEASDSWWQFMEPYTIQFQSY